MLSRDFATKLYLAASTVLAIVLMLFAADLGAAQSSIVTDACAVSVLGAMTFTVAIGDRLIR